MRDDNIKNASTVAEENARQSEPIFDALRRESEENETAATIDAAYDNPSLQMNNAASQAGEADLATDKSELATSDVASGGGADKRNGRVHSGKNREINSALMADFGKSLLFKLREALISVLPISAIVLILCFTPIVDVTTREAGTFAVCAVLLILGIGLFNLGADLAMTPMGEQMGSGLTKTRSLTLLVGVCFVMGILVTVAEPDLSVLAGQVSEVMSKTALIATVGVGVGLFLALAVLKVVYKKNITAILIFFYLVMFSMVALLIERGKGEMLPLVFDSGGVTTGPITVPFIMALGVGISSTIGGARARANSFGLIALCSIGPMLAVLVLSLASNGEMTYALPDYSVISGGSELAAEIGRTSLDVVIALGLIVVSFVVLQLTLLKLPKSKLLRMTIGIIYTFIGLVVFFTAVKVGFMPIGFKLGQSLAKVGKPMLIAFGFIMGFVVVLAEPAVHVLNKQVEQITGGAVSKRAMLIALSIGVGLSIGLSMIRIIYGFSLLYYLIPGYILSLGLSLFVPKLYTAIAFDSGGVASGPLTASFILPMAIGACCALQGEGQVLDCAFGVVAMVAMTPLITIQLLGFRSIFAARFKRQLAMRRIVAADDKQIIEFM